MRMKTLLPALLAASCCCGALLLPGLTTAQEPPPQSAPQIDDEISTSGGELDLEIPDEPVVAPEELVEVAPDDEGADTEGVFFESIQVNLVNVDVYVTDKDGKPITGLKKEDFTLLENKRPMEITNFYAVEGGRPVSGYVPKERDEDAPPLPEHLQEIDIPEDQQLKLILYIDNFNIHPLNRNRVMRDLRQFLVRHVRKEDQVMLVNYARSFKVEQGFTRDPRLINAALTRLEKVTGFGVQTQSEFEDVLNNIDDAQDEFQALATARAYAESTYNDLSFTINALKGFVDSLAGLPGRKAILYVSDGVPRVAGEAAFHYVENRFPRSSAIMESFNYDATRRFQEVIAKANANRVMFYTIDAGGLRTPSHISASQAGGPGRSAGLDSARQANLQAPLYMLAQDTGGKAIVNRNNVLTALNQVGEELRNYYSLGYRPPHSGDGRQYRIKVEVDRKGARLAYRENYRDKTVESVMTDGTLAALHFEIDKNPMEVRVELGEARKRDDKRHYLVPVKVKIPLKNVTLVPQGDAHRGRIRLFLAAKDERGGLSPVQEAPVPIEIPSADVERARQQFYAYSVELLMRSGDQLVAVGVRDEIAAETSFVSQPIRVGAG